MIHGIYKKNLRNHKFLAGIWAKTKTEGLADENKDLGSLSYNN